ncbi:protein of unknown function DUF52 [Thermocrinis albus DSM 14484]|uniref:AmmeMemoRadiSam system protein B n=1 Tax=Thermocrinis albus (strain DSM 14484 / JCM 11386 / HI 11/12) TaxID=638303 RepID=D3SM91_THEAH|nr:AmmeMemoRadiSam system protein B [Thermocrinis albus]ADC89871.1 protein of unknown function DUF52 [Thermocrinis albus DSM 14484]
MEHNYYYMMGLKPQVAPFTVQPLGDKFYVKNAYGLGEGLLVNGSVLLLMHLMDGSRDLLDIKADFLRRTGKLLSEEELRDVLWALDRALLLQNGRLQQILQQIETEIRDRGYLEPSHAGVVYPEDADSCRNFLVGADIKPKERALGVMVPHMDLRVAKETYWQAYGRLEGSYHLVIIMGVSHYFHRHPISFLPVGIKTPFGILEVEDSLLKRIVQRFGDWVFEDTVAYVEEHSIEFQALYVKMLWPKAKVIPMIVAHASTEFMEEVADFMEVILRPYKDDLVVISSVDMSHVGRKFGDPSSYDPSLTDMKYLELMRKLYYPEAYRFLWETDNITRIDGQYTNYLFGALLKRLGSAEGRLLDYRKYVEELTDSVVSYASLVFPVS